MKTNIHFFAILFLVCFTYEAAHSQSQMDFKYDPVMDLVAINGIVLDSTALLSAFVEKMGEPSKPVPPTGRDVGLFYETLGIVCSTPRSTPRPPH